MNRVFEDRNRLRLPLIKWSQGHAGKEHQAEPNYLPKSIVFLVGQLLLKTNDRLVDRQTDRWQTDPPSACGFTSLSDNTYEEKKFCNMEIMAGGGFPMKMRNSGWRSTYVMVIMHKFRISLQFSICMCWFNYKRNKEQPLQRFKRTWRNLQVCCLILNQNIMLYQFLPFSLSFLVVLHFHKVRV